MSNIVITTPRLKLRYWKEEDNQPFIEMNRDAEVMRFFPKLQTEEETLQQIKRIKKHFEEYGYGLYAMERIDDGDFIGFTGFSHPTFKSHFTPCVEIGWRLKADSWGNGFATEAAIACLKYGFTELQLPEIYSFTAAINLPSVNVMKKCGMAYLETFEHPAMTEGDKLKTHVLYKANKW